ncbi:FG-GAP-like repeat-containing protein [Streptomyces sp. enrichment culture]|uniref:FG-GAP-like repeat-containing protein n=1 Tax=Streptomyces sp. enrichment culture TaxID=1795815 RepID=UPI003F569E1A
MAAACAAGAVVVPQQAAAVSAGTEVVIPAALRATPRADRVVFAGDSGFLHQREGDGVLWTPYADPDASTELDWLTGDSRKYANNGAWGDVVANPAARIGSTTTVTFRDMRDGTSRKLVLPAGQTYAGSFGDTVLSVTHSGTDVVSWHLLRLVDGEVEDRPVSGFPEGAVLRAWPTAANPQGVYTSYTVDGVTHPAWVDLADASATPILEDHRRSGARSALLGDRLTVWHTDGAVAVFDTADFSQPVRTFSVPYEKNARLLGTAGDAVLIARYDLSADGTVPAESARVHRIVAVSADGGGERTLLTQASADVDAARDGSVVVVAGGDPEAASIQRIAVVDGAPQATVLTSIPAVRSESVVPSVANGRMLTVDHTLGTALSLNQRTISATSPLTYSAATARTAGRTLDWSDCFEPFPCPDVRATGDGRMLVDDYSNDPLLVSADGTRETPLGTTLQQPQLDDASGRFALVRGMDDVQTGRFLVQVVDLDRNAPLRTLADGDYALWGRTLWQRGSTTGTFVPMDVVTGTKGAAVSVGSGCGSPVRVSAAGDWLSWSCRSGTAKAGVKNLRTGRTTPLNRHVDALGDGWVASGTGDGSGTVIVDDVTSATPTEATRFTSKSGTPGLGWSADPYGGPLAWVDAQENVHVARVGTVTSPLAQIDSDTPAGAAVKGGAASWTGRWWLSKPAASWRLTLRNKATGATVRTLAGGETRGAVSAAWNGTTATGALVANGTYAWTLTAQPADGHGTALVRTGTVKVSGAAAVRRDHAGASGTPDGTGDLLTLTSGGTLAFQRGDGTGKFGGTTSGSGWPASVTAVPFGDLNGDRCNDVLVRLSDGSLRGYRPGCGKALTPSTPYTRLGTGWNAHDVLTSPGDLTGDGRADLLTRRASTGDAYLYAAKADGTLAAARRIGTGWGTYTEVVGAGDLTGDGVGDVLARDRAGNLWRYDGLRTGALKGRVKVFSGWGASYDAVVGVGDITGDGRADLVARDTAGNLWRQAGNGKGSFSARVKIASGWQGYKGLF